MPATVTVTANIPSTARHTQTYIPQQHQHQQQQQQPQQRRRRRRRRWRWRRRKPFRYNIFNSHDKFAAL
jgi:hypothetical protein